MDEWVAADTAVVEFSLSTKFTHAGQILQAAVCVCVCTLWRINKQDCSLLIPIIVSCLINILQGHLWRTSVWVQTCF